MAASESVRVGALNVGTAAAPYTLDFETATPIRTLAAAGKNGAGAVTLTGAKKGDKVLSIFGAPTAGGAMEVKLPGTDFEAQITVVDQIQQVSSSNLSTNTYVFQLVPTG